MWIRSWRTHLSQQRRHGVVIPIAIVIPECTIPIYLRFFSGDVQGRPSLLPSKSGPRHVSPSDSNS
jgi:hypothetical protein